MPTEEDDVTEYGEERPTNRPRCWFGDTKLADGLMVKSKERPWLLLWG